MNAFAPSPDAAPRPLTVRMATPRGFCAGVDRAIQIVERRDREIRRARSMCGTRSSTTRTSSKRLEAMGAVFVEGTRPNARTTARSSSRPMGCPRRCRPTASRARELLFLDATCPLVSKVHVEAERHHANGRHIILIGHAGHPEVVGTLGQLPDGAISLVETVEDAEVFQRPGEQPLAYATQTTLSLDDTSEILGVLKRRFPELPDPHKEDICYATTNRQDAVKQLAVGSDLVLVVGSKNSSNSVRLVEVALRAGAGNARLIDDASQIDWSWLDGVSTVGVTAGASAPEPLVQAVVRALQDRFDVTLAADPGEPETVTFKLPRALTA